MVADEVGFVVVEPGVEVDEVVAIEDVVGGLALFVVEELVIIKAPTAATATTMITMTIITAAIVEIERFVEVSLLLCMRHGRNHGLFKSCDHPTPAKLGGSLITTPTKYCQCKCLGRID